MNSADQRNVFVLLFCVFLGAAGAVPNAAAQKRGEKAAPAGGWTEDKGRYRVVVDGQPAGIEDFQISRAGNEWVARGTVEIPAAGGTSKLTGKLRVSATGAPISYDYDWAPHGGKKISATVTFEEGLARMDTQMEGAQPFSQDFKFDTPVIALLDNNLYHQYTILARIYDWEKKGAQTFPVLIPQDQTPGTITVEWVSAHAVEGQKLDLLRVRSADLEIELYVDSSRRVLRIAVPASKAEVVRE